MTTAAKAQAALDRRRRSEETLAALWIRVHGEIPRHWVALVERLDRWLADYKRGERGTTTRIVVSAPPGYAKSTLATLLAARCITLGIDSLLFSYSGALARNKSSKTKKLVEEHFAGKIDRQVSSPAHWQMVSGGSMHASGLGGSGTGFRGILVEIDDHTLGRAHAESPAHREATIDAVRSVARTRVEPGGLVLIVSTRWHILDASAVAIEAGYEYINVPALDASDRSTWEERFTTPELLQVRDELGDRDWSALYQGHPSQNASLLFRDCMLMQPKDLPTAGLTISAGLDCAYSSRSSSDATAAVIMAQIPNGPTVVVDVLRVQDGIETLIPKLVAFAAKHGKPTFRWHVGGQEGVAVAPMLRAAGLRIDATPARVDKISRAQRCAAAWNRGRLVVLADQPWTDRFVAEVTAFGPGARKDDQVDAAVSAYDAVPSEAVDHGWQYAPARKAWSINDVMPQIGTPEFSVSTGWAQSQARRNRIGGM